MKEQIIHLINETIKRKLKYAPADASGVYITGQIRVLTDLLNEIAALED